MTQTENEPKAAAMDGTPLFRLGARQQAYRERAAAVAALVAPTAAETDRSERYPWGSVDALRAAGLMGMTIPPELGGEGATALDVVVVVEELAKVCGATARIAVESNVGAIGAVMRYGTQRQRELAAELVLAGDKPAICITEPGAGSAATHMTTRAERDGDRFVIRGEKHWITGGGVSRLHLIFARMIEDGKDRGINGFLVVRDPDSGTPAGLVIGQRALAMGIRGIPEMQLVFDGLEVPEDMLLRTPGGPERAFAALMSAYNAQRVGAAAVALGIATGAYELAIEYVQRREQFGRPLADFQGLQWMLADMAIQLEAARGLLYRAAAVGPLEFPDMEEAAQAKIFVAEVAQRVTNDALQLHGAAGYGRALPLERMVRDARMFTISGGTAQVLRNQVAGRILRRNAAREARAGQ